MDVGADSFRFTLEEKNGRDLPVQPIRMPATTELHIDSLDRYMPNMIQTTASFTNFPNQAMAKLAGPILLNNILSATGYTGYLNVNGVIPLSIQTSRPLTYGYYSRVALTQFFLRFQQPTFLGGTNATIFIYYGTAPGTITGYAAVTPGVGWFTYATYATALQVAVRAIAGNPLPAFTCSPPALPGDGFAFATGNPLVYMAFAVGVPPAAAALDTEFLSIQNLRCGRNLGLNRACYGFGPDQNVTGQPGAPALWTAAAGGPPNFLPTDYIDIVSQSLTNYKDAKDTNSSIQAPSAVIGRIWLTEGSVDVAGGTAGGADLTQIGSAPISLVKNWMNPNWCKWSPNQTIDKIDITLLDMFGFPIPWSSTYQTEWSGTLTMTE